MELLLKINKKLSAQNIKHLWEKAVFVFDANVLLDLENKGKCIILI